MAYVIEQIEGLKCVFFIIMVILPHAPPLSPPPVSLSIVVLPVRRFCLIYSSPYFRLIYVVIYVFRYYIFFGLCL